MIIALTSYKLGTFRKPLTWVTTLVLTLFVLGFAILAESYIDPAMTDQEVYDEKTTLLQ